MREIYDNITRDAGGLIRELRVVEDDRAAAFRAYQSGMEIQLEVSNFVSEATLSP